MTTIVIAANDQDLTITQKPLLASGDKETVILHVDFCAKWEGFTKTAVFYQSANNVYHALLDGEDECVVPWEVLEKEGTLFFGIFGNKGETRKTTEVLAYKIVKGAWTEDTSPSDPTPDIYTQIMSRCNEVIQAAEAVVDIADAANANASAALTAANAAVSYNFTAIIPADGWVEVTDCVDQTVTVTGVLATDKPICDLNSDGLGAAELIALTEEWAKIIRVTAFANSIKIEASEVPSIDIPIKLMAIRK